MGSPHGLVLPFLLAADVHLVTFHRASEHVPVALCIEPPDFLKHIPSRCLGDMDVAAQLMGGNALLMAADKVHGHKPLDEREFGVLKDCTDKAGEVTVTPRAVKATILGHPAQMLATIGTDHIAVTPT